MAINIKKYSGLISGSKYIFLLNVTDKVFSFVIMLLLARNFSAEIYGQIVTLIALSMVFISIFDLGLPIFIQREIAESPLNASAVFSRVFTLGSILILIYYSASLLTLKIIYPDIPYTLFSVISVMMYISFLVTISNKALAGLNEYRAQFTAFILPRAVVLIIFFAGIYYFELSASLLFTIMLGGIFVNLLLALFYLYRNKVRISLSYFQLNSVLQIIAVSLPLGLAVVFNFLYDKIDLLLISGITDYDSAAVYSIAYGLFKSSSIAFSFLLVSGFTKIAEMKRDPGPVRDFFIEHAKLISVICIICSVILFVFPEYIIGLLYSGRFTDSASVLRILSIALIAMGLNNLTGVILNGMGYFKAVMYITLYALIMNASLNILFIPVYGIKAAAVISIITEYFILVTEWVFLVKILKALEAKKA